MSDSLQPETSLKDRSKATEQASPSLSPRPFQLDDLTATSDPVAEQPDRMLGEVELDLRIELGRTRMRLEDVLQLRVGSVVTLDNAASDPVEVYVNNRLIARGEMLVMNERFCVRITELVGS